MGFFSDLKAKMVGTLVGDLVADLGALPIDDHGRELSVFIRRRPGKAAHLQLKLAIPGGGAEFIEITRTAGWAEQFERVAQELRKQGAG